MAAIAKHGRPSLSSLTPPSNEVVSGLRAGEDIAAGDLCTVNSSTGLVMKHTDGVVHGIATEHDRSTGESVTLYRNVRVAYGKGMTPGSDVFASATVAGGLDTSGGEDGVAIGWVVDGERIQFTGL